MTNIPTPRYAIGDTVFVGNTEQRRTKHACPDCLGTGKWEVTTPAGGKFSAVCLRCSGYSRPADLPPLDTMESVATRAA
jgi:hypothetical protein